MTSETNSGTSGQIILKISGSTKNDPEISKNWLKYHILNVFRMGKYDFVYFEGEYLKGYILWNSIVKYNVIFERKSYILKHN